MPCVGRRHGASCATSVSATKAPHRSLATAYGKLTGRLAACFGIAGPGSTNLLTGLYDAKVDRAPVLALSGQVPSKTKGRGAFQDMDLHSAFKDVARFGEVVLSGADHAELMTLACKTALVERDVASLIFPDEVQVERSNQEASGPDGRTGSRDIAPPVEVVAEAIERIRNSERPVIVVGQGARPDMDAVVDLAELIGAPVITTFKAKGAISDHHPLGCGVLGRSGTPVASWLMNESDLVIVFGASFSNHTGIAPYKPIIQVDRDPMAIGRHHPVEIGLQGAVAITARQLTAGLDGRRSCVDQRSVDRRALADLARGEGEPPDRRPRQGHERRVDLRRAVRPPPIGRGDLCRCRQQHLLVRPLLRGDRTGRPDVGLPRLHRVLVPGGHGRLGRRRERTQDRLRVR